MTKRHRQLAAKLAELDGQRQALLKEGAAISDRAEQEKRSLLSEEKTRADAILTELDELKGQIDAVQADISREIRLEDHERGQIADITQRSPATVTQVDGEFRGLGEFLQAVAAESSMGVRAALGAERVRILQTKLATYSAAGSGMSVGVPSDGGHLVRNDW